MTVQVKLNENGLKELKQLQVNLIKDIGDTLVEESKIRAPVATGNLRDSIEVKSLDDDKVSVGTGVPYALYVEYGTSRQSGQAFLRPSLDYVINNLSDLEK